MVLNICNHYLEEKFGLNEHVLLYSVVPYVFCLLSLMVGFLSKDIKNKLSCYQIIIIGLITLAVIGLIFTSLYIQWTKPDQTSIAGVQGRYFLPILPLMILLLRKI